MEPTLRGDLGHRDPALGAETRAGPGPVRAGDRPPDGRVDGTRLFDAFRGPHWTLLALGADAPEPPAGLRLVRGPSHRPDVRHGPVPGPPGRLRGLDRDTPDGLGACLARFGTR
ncbi:hypothetical protein ACOZDF_00070 [Streptomyces griseoincarnatus]|uniref:hypothetical protein n=1 Tax=Streptomyces sp. E1N211 TaxID=1851876 RepID=UPI0026A997A5